MLSKYLELSFNVCENDLYDVISNYIVDNDISIEDVECIESLGFDIIDFSEELLN